MAIETLPTSSDATDTTSMNRQGQLADSYSECPQSALGAMPDNDPDPGPPPHPPPTKPLPAPPKPPQKQLIGADVRAKKVSDRGCPTNPPTTRPRSLLSEQSKEQRANVMSDDNATSNAELAETPLLKCPPAPSTKPVRQPFGPYLRHMVVRSMDNGRRVDSCLTGQRLAVAAAAQ